MQTILYTSLYHDDALRLKVVVGFPHNYDEMLNIRMTRIG